jgi:Protein of unknown function (DUF3422)
MKQDPAPSEQEAPYVSQSRLPLPLDAPALTWLRVFRPVEDDDPIAARGSDEEKIRHNRVLRAINLYFEQNKKISDATVSFVCHGETISTTRRPRNENLYFRHNFDSQILRLHSLIFCYAETFSISNYLTLEEVVLLNPRLEVEEYNLSTNPAIREIEDAFLNVFRLLRDPISASLATDRTAKLASQAAYKEIWQKIDKSLEMAPINGIAKLLGDFRGIITTSRSPSAQSAMRRVRNSTQGKITGLVPLIWSDPSFFDVLPDDGEVVSKSDIRAYGVDLSENISPLKLPRYSETAVQQIFSDNQRYVNQRSPFFSHVLYGGQAEAPGRPGNGAHSALCGFLDGLAIHGSNLRAQIDSKVENQSWYFIVYGGTSGHQLGRLILRLHRAATIRVLAMFDQPALRSAAKEIRQVSLGLDQLPILKEETVKDFSEQMALQENLLEEIMKRGRGGIKFRTSKSGYYTETLNQILSDLRIVRIPGWQTYSDFIRRHIITEGRNIASIKEQLVELETRMRRLLTQVTNVSISGATKAISAASTATSEATEATRDITESLAESESAVAELQEVAEYFGIFALAYYGGTIIEKSGFVRQLQSWLTSLNVNITIDSKLYWTAILLFALLLVIVRMGMSAARKYKKKKQKEAKGSKENPA